MGNDASELDDDIYLSEAGSQAKDKEGDSDEIEERGMAKNN